ncbi:alpha-L-fucosidase [Streptomyces sp. S6]
MPRQLWFTDAKLGIFVHWGIYGVRSMRVVGAGTELHRGAGRF